MRVVLDTNVLISAVLFGGVPRELLRHVIHGRIEAITSPVLLDEFQGVLEEKFGFPRAAATETRAEFEILAEVVTPAKIPKICRDPDDNEVLATAVAGGASVIVTGDEDLLALRPYEQIDILKPAAFMRRLGDV